MMATQLNPWLRNDLKELPVNKQPVFPKDIGPTCFFFIGLPGSGKTTYCHQNFDVLPRVSSDDHIELMCRERGLTYSQGFSMYAKEAEAAMYRDLENFIAWNVSFVWDQTNLSSLSRMKKLERVPSTYNAHAFVFREPKNLTERLNSRPGKVIPAHVIDNMRSAFEYPTKEEGFSFITDVIT